MLRTFGKQGLYSGFASPSELQRPPSKMLLIRSVETSTILLQISAAIFGSAHLTEILMTSVLTSTVVVSLYASR